MAKLILFDAKTVPDTHLLAVGMALHKWSYLESTLEEICWLLLGLPNKEGRLVFSQMLSSAKITVYRALVERLLPTDSDRKVAEEIGRQADELNTKRNRLVHGQWAHTPEPESALVRYVVSGKSHNRILPKIERTKVEDLHKICQQTEEQTIKAEQILSSLKRASHDPSKNRLR